MTGKFTAVCILICTIIGAGFLGIPYVAMQSGFSIALLHLIVIGIIITISMLYLGEIMLRTKEPHHLIGYAEKYLGKKGKNLMSFSLIFGIYSALTAYILAQGESWSHLLFGTSSYSLQAGIIFWLVLSLISYSGLKALKEAEPLGVSIVSILIFSIALITFNKIEISNLNYINTSQLLAPFGVILFAFLGFSALPEVLRSLGTKKYDLKKTIIFAHLFVFTIYIFFTALVLGYKGLSTPEIATLALGKPFILLGILTILTASLSLSVALSDSYRIDLKKTKIKSWIYTILVPLLAFIIINTTKIAGFTTLLSIGGVISGGISLMLIMSMIKKAKKKSERNPEYSLPYNNILSWIINILIITGIIFEVIKLST